MITTPQRVKDWLRTEPNAIALHGIISGLGEAIVPTDAEVEYRDGTRVRMADCYARHPLYGTYITIIM